MVRWTLDVPEDLDAEVRSMLAKRGGGDLTDYVNETMRRRVLRDTINDIRADNRDLTPEAADELANEAVDWARASRP
ncbi:MAG: ribbon-helix-helix domain-containing protein [Planctomycetota bacterium]